MIGDLTQENPKEAPGRIVHRNINDLLKARTKLEQKQSRSERLAGAITRAAGSMWFAYLHALWFGAWIAWNLLRGTDAPDPFPFSLLTTIVSLEAIFLTLMVLVSQNREAQLEEQRANLDLQVDLLAEHEVTALICLVREIARKVGVEEPCGTDIDELATTVRPRDMLRAMEQREQS